MKEILDAFGIGETHSGGYGGDWIRNPGGGTLDSVSPVDGRVVASVQQVSARDCEAIVRKSRKAFEAWRDWPAPKRGEVVRQIGHEFRKVKRELGALVTWEMGKIRAEGEGEVQEAIDMADFAVGLSRQLYGRDAAGPHGAWHDRQGISYSASHL